MPGPRAECEWPMLWNDLREYLNKLDQLGELQTVLGCDWQEEIGGITELITEARGAALLFDEIQDYPAGYRVAANLFNTPSRTATFPAPIWSSPASPPPSPGRDAGPLPRWTQSRGSKIAET